MSFQVKDVLRDIAPHGQSDKKHDAGFTRLPGRRTPPILWNFCALTNPPIEVLSLHYSLTEPLPVLAPHPRLDDRFQIGPREGKHLRRRGTSRTRIRGRITGWLYGDWKQFEIFTLMTKIILG